MDKIKQQKIDMWKKKLVNLEKELDKVMQRKGEAAAMGDLSENAAYKMAMEEADTYRARIADVKKILRDLGVDPADLEEQIPVKSGHKRG